KRDLVTAITLSEIIQGKKERLWSYIDQFTQVSIKVYGVEEGLKCWIFENYLWCDHPFRLKIGRKKVRTAQEMLTIAQSNMILEENMNTHFDNSCITRALTKNLFTQ
ncbi:hypothetical protein RYX36_021392, partial [Vicia faba]